MNFATNFSTIIIAFISGFVPAFIWLYFWTREDKKNPEPKNMITLAFIGGMVAVFISLFFEKYFYGLNLENLLSSSILSDTLSWLETTAKHASVVQEKIFTINDVLLVIIFAPIIEEIIKFVMAYILVLRSKEDNEPLDPMIYMITTALGFAAIENVLFLITPLANHDFFLSISTGNLRFIGAMLLHVISSGIIAIFISFNFFKSKTKKILFTSLGIICSIFIHSIFNFLMIGSHTECIMALELIWIAVIIILLIFEKIKKIRAIDLT